MEGGFVNTHVATWWLEGWLDTSSLTLLYPAFFSLISHITRHRSASFNNATITTRPNRDHPLVYFQVLLEVERLLIRYSELHYRSVITLLMAGCGVRR